MSLKVRIGSVILACCSLGIGAVLPGYVPQQLGRPAVTPADLRSLVEALSLSGDEAAAAHAVLTEYADTIRSGGETTRAEVSRIQVEAAPDAVERLEARRQAVESARDRIEALRKQGVFDGDPAAMREAYAEAVEEARRDLAEVQGDVDRNEAWGEAFSAQGELLEAWFAEAASLTAEVRGDLAVIAAAGRENALEQWWIDTQVNRALKRGRISGERLDPIRICAAVGVSIDVETASAFRQAHLELLERREAALQALPIEAAAAVSADRPRRWRRAAERAMAAREAVRDHALASSEDMLASVPEPEAASAQAALHRAAFPGVWTRDHGTRTLKAAAVIADLNAAQQGMVDALLADHEARMDVLRLRQQDAVLAEEGRRMVDQDVARAATFFTAEPDGPSVYKRTTASTSERRVLINDSLRQLQAILTEQQWATLPGTRTRPVRD